MLTARTVTGFASDPIVLPPGPSNIQAGRVAARTILRKVISRIVRPILCTRIRFPGFLSDIPFSRENDVFATICLVDVAFNVATGADDIGNVVRSERSWCRLAREGDCTLFFTRTEIGFDLVFVIGDILQGKGVAGSVMCAGEIPVAVGASPRADVFWGRNFGRPFLCKGTVGTRCEHYPTQDQQNAYENKFYGDVMIHRCPLLHLSEQQVRVKRARF